MIIRIIISFIVFWFWNLYRYGQWSDEDDDDDNDASGGAFGSHDDIDFNFLHNKWGLGFKT